MGRDREKGRGKRGRLGRVERKGGIRFEDVSKNHEVLEWIMKTGSRRKRRGGMEG